jgi:hypothetical protein
VVFWFWFPDREAGCSRRVKVPHDNAEDTAVRSQNSIALEIRVASSEVTMLHARELADRIDLTNGAKTCILNPDEVFGIHNRSPILLQITDLPEKSHPRALFRGDQMLSQQIGGISALV